jgi:hypothetical protein
VLVGDRSMQLWGPTEGVADERAASSAAVEQANIAVAPRPRVIQSSQRLARLDIAFRAPVAPQPLAAATWRPEFADRGLVATGAETHTHTHAHTHAHTPRAHKQKLTTRRSWPSPLQVPVRVVAAPGALGVWLPGCLTAGQCMRAHAAAPTGARADPSPDQTCIIHLSIRPSQRFMSAPALPVLRERTHTHTQRVRAVCVCQGCTRIHAGVFMLAQLLASSGVVGG